MSLYEKIVSHQEKIALVGLGYVGMPIAVAFAKKAPVIGFDVNEAKIELYRSGIDPTHEVGDAAIRSTSVRFTANETDLRKAKFLIVAVPTPVNQDKTPDLAPVIGASEVVGRNLTPGSIVVYESTVYPGVTEDICVPILERESGLKCGVDFKVGYSPERINPGDKVHRLENIRKIVSGMDKEALEEIQNVYNLVIEVGTYPVSSIKTAEAIKVVENSQRDINIAFMNELAMVFDRMGIAFNLDLFYSDSLTVSELNRMTLLVLILTVNTAIGFSASSYNAVVSSHERFLFLQIINIITTCIGPIVNLIVLYLGFASIGMVVASLLLNIFVRVLYIIFVRHSLQIRPRYNNMPIHLVKEVLMFSFWVFLANIVSQLYNATDTMIIGAIPALATIGVAIYNVGATFQNMVFSLAQAVSTLFAPRANKMVFSGASNEELTDFVIRVGRYQCYVITLVCSGFVAFGRQFITWYVGTEYMDAYWVAIFMMIPSCIPLVQSAANCIAQAKNKHQFRSITYLFIAILNVIGTYFLVNSYGIVGAALMTGLANILGQGLLMNWYYWKKIGLNIPRFWKSILHIEWIPLLMCIATLYLGQYIDFSNIPMFFVGVIIYIAVYFLLSWKFSFLPEEKKQVLEPIRKLKKK